MLKLLTFGCLVGCLGLVENFDRGAGAAGLGLRGVGWLTVQLFHVAKCLEQDERAR